MAFDADNRNDDAGPDAPELLWRFDDAAALKQAVDEQVLKGRALFAHDPTVAERDTVSVVLERPDGTRSAALPGEAVWVRDGQVGVEFAPLDDAAAKALTVFAHVAAAGDGDLDGSAGPGTAAAGSGDPAANVHARVRGLSAAERTQLARHGNRQERQALERAYGKAVWEALLSNPQITPPEVATIARNGTVPIPLVGTICAKPQWLNQPEVRRALLTNPRVKGTNLDRILNALPRPELKQVPQQTAYTGAVRAAATRLLKRRGG